MINIGGKMVVEEKFSGKIYQIVNGAQWDATSFIVIEDKMVIFGVGGVASEGNPDQAKRGSLIGFNLEKSGWEKKCLNKKVEVFAKLSENSDKIVKNNKLSAKQYLDEGEKVPKDYLYLTKVNKVYTLYGNEKYFVKLG